MIQCTIREAAQKIINSSLVNHTNYKLKLFYDTVGCGCVNDGVVYLGLVDQVDPNRDILIKSDTYPVYIEKQYEIYYEEELILDFDHQYQCFQLKSPNQYINPRMRFEIITTLAQK